MPDWFVDEEVVAIMATDYEDVDDDIPYIYIDENGVCSLV